MYYFPFNFCGVVMKYIKINCLANYKTLIIEFMGNTEIKTDPVHTGLTINDFKLHKIIGSGGFSEVWKATYRKTNKDFAIKEMHKSRIVRKNCVNSVLNELQLLSILKHPFIVNIQYAFQDRSNLYLVMDLMPGGDLRHFLGNKSLSEIQTQFIISCILIGLEYLHINGVVHKDLKPENLVFDNKGFLRITDFGIAFKVGKFNDSDGSGTPGYMSPESMFHRKQKPVSDYFALGVIAFECMLGKIPYCGKSKKEIKDKIFSKQVQLKKKDVPQGWSLESVDFINKLLQRNPEERLGRNGIHEIKNHSWVSNVQWKKMLEKRVDSPCKFSNSENTPNIAIEVRRTDLDFDLEYVQKYFYGYKYIGNESFGMNSTIMKKIYN